MAEPGPEGDGRHASGEARPLRRRVRDAGHRPHPEVGRLRLRAASTWSIPASASRRSRARSATSRRRTCRPSCACRRRSTTIIARAMDMGAEGLMLPMVGTADEVRHIVDSMKYHPAGRRGVALQIAHDRYRPGSVADKFAAANRRIDLLLPDRDRRGRRERRRASRRSTASTACGSAISTSRCRSASRASSTIRPSRRAIDKIVAAAKKHNKSLGRLVPTVEQGVELFAQGFDFICYSGDVWVLHDALAEAIGQICARAASRRGGDDGRRNVPRGALRRLQEGRRLADLSRLRPRAAAHGARRRDGVPRVRATRCAPSSSRTSTR